MDLKNLTGTIIDKAVLDTKTIRPSVASSNQLPNHHYMQPQQLKALQTLLQHQQIGKVFDVVVAKIEGTTVFLSIPGLPADSPILKAELANPPPVGTRLTLQLTDETNKPHLKVIAAPNSPQDVVSRNLRTTLQQQQPLTPLLANLAQIAKSPHKLATELPQDIIDAVRSVIQQLPKAEHIRQGANLKQAIQASGPFLENSLAKNELLMAARPDPVKPDVIKTFPANIHAAKDESASHPLLHDRLAKTEQKSGMPKEAFERTNYNEVTLAKLESFFNAMRQQPVLDVRTNLLRLASLLKTMNEQARLTPQQQDTAEQKADLITRAARPPLSELHQTAHKPGTIKIDSTALPGTTSQTQAGAQTQTQQLNTSIRSQIPQAQAQANPGINTLLTQESVIDQLLGQIEGSLSRIQVQQLQTLATEQQHRPMWVIELPVRTDQGIDLFDLRIGRDTEEHQVGDPKAPWVVTLAFDLEHLGPVQIRLALYGEDQINASIWAEQQATSAYFNQHLDKLKARLIKVGLDVKRLNCQCGKPDVPPPSNEPRLVDEKV